VADSRLKRWGRDLRRFNSGFAPRAGGQKAGPSRYSSGPYQIVSDALDHDIDELRRRIERLEKQLGPDPS
jgi:hypothetical protein